MNYRHAYHAGNFADVVKHIALVCILLHLKKKESGFAVIDSHAGRGVYDLSGGEARRTGEAAGGIARLAAISDGPAALATYLELVRAGGEAAYPGSPLIAAKLLRPQDRLVAIEKHPDDAAVLAATLAPYRKARVECTDGYRRLLALLPPVERRGLVLIDPPYEAADEFARVGRAFAEAQRRFATGHYLIWFPIKGAHEADAFCGEVLAAGPRKLLRLDIEVDGSASDEKLGAAGLLIVNPPHLFEEEMRASLAKLLPLLGRDPAVPARSKLHWLAGSDS